MTDQTPRPVKVLTWAEIQAKIERERGDGDVVIVVLP